MGRAGRWQRVGRECACGRSVPSFSFSWINLPSSSAAATSVAATRAAAARASALAACAAASAVAVASFAAAASASAATAASSAETLGPLPPPLPGKPPSGATVSKRRRSERSRGRIFSGPPSSLPEDADAACVASSTREAARVARESSITRRRRTSEPFHNFCHECMRHTAAQCRNYVGRLSLGFSRNSYYE